MKYRFARQSTYAGVYLIRNRRNKKVYVGSSIDIETRIRKHKKLLEQGKHTNKDMQADYNAGNSFDIEIMAVYPRKIGSDDSELRKLIQWKEREFIRKYNSIKNGYNVLDIGVALESYMSIHNNNL